MQYRRLGRSGLKISQFSLGSWITFGGQLDAAAARELMAAAYDAGINFFDNAEVYGHGRSEEIMGEALRGLGWPRLNYLVSTKFFWGLDRAGHGRPPNPNRQDTLNRKYLMQAMDRSLKRMGLEHIDLIFCHRPDPETPLEETVRAMSDLISQGKALYWGTSEWPPQQILRAWTIADRHHLHKPIVEQPQYNLFHRWRVEHEYAPLYRAIGLGLTTWSPLAGGLLTGKYRDGLPPASRGSDPGNAYLRDGLLDRRKKQAVMRLERLAADLDTSAAALALAWTTRNPHVSTAIIGVSRQEQLAENLRALSVLPKLSAPVLKQIDTITAYWRNRERLRTVANAIPGASRLARMFRRH